MGSLRRAASLLVLVVVSGVSGCFAPNFSPINVRDAIKDGGVSANDNLALVAATRTPPESSAGMLEYVKSAAVENSEVAAFREAELVAKSRIETALSTMRPQVSVSSAVGGYKSDISSGEVERGASVNLTVSQLLFDGGVASSLISEAELELALARASTRTVMNRVSGQVATAGVTLVFAANDLKAIQLFKKELKPYVDQLELIARSGLIGRSVLDDVNSRWLELDIAEQEARTALNLAEIECLQYFRDLSILTSDFVLPDAIQASLFIDLSSKDTPAVQEAALRIMIAEKQLEHANSAFFPTISAQAGSSSPMDPNEDISAQLGLSFSYQFGDGGAREAKLNGAKAFLEQTKRSAQALIERTETSLDSFEVKLKNMDNIIQLADAKRSILIGRLNVAERQIQSGQADVAKVFDIKLQVHEVEGRIRRVKSDSARTKIKLAAALGLFTK